VPLASGRPDTEDDQPADNEDAEQGQAAGKMTGAVAAECDYP
jgi:hypothetical protein